MPLSPRAGQRTASVLPCRHQADCLIGKAYSCVPIYKVIAIGLVYTTAALATDGCQWTLESGPDIDRMPYLTTGEIQGCRAHLLEPVRDCCVADGHERAEDQHCEAKHTEKSGV